MKRSLRFLGIAGFVAAFLSGCISDRVAEKMLENAVVVPTLLQTAPTPPSFQG